jgi:hypothetical protein
MGMRQTIDDIFDCLVSDESLIRLLHYLPKNDVVSLPDPLSSKLPNILDDLESQWKVIDEHVKLSPKSSDLVDKDICRIYIHLGNRIPYSSGSFKMATQEIHIDILTHESFEIDSRIARICDRINELLIHNRITGLGMVEYVRGLPHPAPQTYSGYRQTYKVGNTKK